MADRRCAQGHRDDANRGSCRLPHGCRATLGPTLSFLGRHHLGSGLLRVVASKRTGATGIAVDDVYRQSLAAEPGQVLDIYLGMPVIGAPYWLPIAHFFTVGALLFVCGIVVLLDYQGGAGTQPSPAPKSRAMGASWFVALLGPLGWFLLARPHSFIHTHINPAIWFLPTIPMGLRADLESHNQRARRPQESAGRCRCDRRNDTGFGSLLPRLDGNGSLVGTLGSSREAFKGPAPNWQLPRTPNSVTA